MNQLQNKNNFKLKPNNNKLNTRNKCFADYHHGYASISKGLYYKIINEYISIRNINTSQVEQS